LVLGNWQKIYEGLFNKKEGENRSRIYWHSYGHVCLKKLILLNFESKREWLKENISLPNSSGLISESFRSSNSLKIGSEWESEVDLEIILITRFCKETRRRRLVLYVDPQTVIS